MIRELSIPAQQIIDHYRHLHIGGKTIRCPYVNNKHTHVRAALRVLVGKGMAKEIEEEAFLIALREKIPLDQLNEQEIQQFLVDNRLGIDCSAFAFYILNAEKGNKLYRCIRPLSNNPLRRMIARLRTVENVNVKTLSDEKNSKEISLQEIAPGDIITMIGTGEKHNLDHVLIIDRVEYKKDQPQVIHYVHSLQWKKDGKYNHGIREGKIDIQDLSKTITEQTWEEDGYSNTKENETLWRAQTAQEIHIRRLVCVN